MKKLIRLARWHSFVKNWPLRVLERVGLARGELVYRMRNQLSLRLRGGPHHSDALILWDIYVNHPYTPPGFEITQDQVIVDIGAHIGLFSTWAASQAPGVRVYGFEANPENFRLYSANVVKNCLGSKITALPLAVAGSDGEAVLHLHEEGTGGSSLYRERVKQHRGRSVRVETLSLASVVERFGIDRVDLLKLDCEGAEYDILYQAPGATLNKIRRIAMEYHEVAGQSPESLERFLTASGFVCRRAENGHVLYANRKDLS